MTALLENLLSASFHGSIVIAAVLLLRLVLKKAPRKYICWLWLLAGLRLLMPFEIESALSLQPKVEMATLSQWVEQDDNGHIFHPDESMEEGTQMFPLEENPIPVQDAQPHPELELAAQYYISWYVLLPYLWLTGVCAMGSYTVASYLRLRRRVGDAVILCEGVWLSGKLDSAFVLGFFRPQVYLSANLSETERELVLAHERCHIRRGDHWWKLLGFVALMVHWFNPLVWAGYVLLCRDLEMACDEAVVQEMNTAQRKAYSVALLSCSVKGHIIAVCPVAFGETDIKGRITNVLNYRKSPFWIILFAVASIIVVAVCFLTTPEGWTETEMLEQFYETVGQLQSQEECYIQMCMDIDSESSYVVSQTQEFWQEEHGDWYRTFEYQTDAGSVTTVYMQINGVQYACEYSEDIPGFEERGWQKLPENNYAELPPILTKDFTKLEVLEIKNDAAGFQIVLQNDWKSEDSKEKVYDYTYTFCFDQEGQLTDILSYSHTYGYLSSFGREGYSDIETNTSIVFLEPDSEMCLQLINEGLKDIQ